MPLMPTLRADADSAAGRLPGGLSRRLLVHAGIAWASIFAYVLALWVGEPEATPLAAFGVSACGWAWLLSRAVFDPAPQDAWWPRLVVAVLMVTGAVWVLTPDGALRGLADNIYDFGGSAAMVLTLVEPFQRHGCALTRAEVRFRAAFVTVFSLFPAVAVLGAWPDPAPIQTACATLSLVGVGASIAWRLRHPLVRASRPPAPRKAATEDETRLGARLIALVQDEAIHTDPVLRIGDVAARLNEPEHRISRAVSALGFANFNRLINHHRIEQAKRMLVAVDGPRSILEVAQDCGFASLGPFNRAFKDETGVTPREFRAGVGHEA